MPRPYHGVVSEPDAGAPQVDTTIVETGAPPLGARIGAFAAILAAGLAGGFIGYGITDLQCTGDCTVNNAIGALVGALLGAVGVAIVAVLALRAMHEWRTIVATDATAKERELEAKRARRARSMDPRRRPRVQ